MTHERNGGMRSVSGHLDSPTLPELRTEIVPDNLRAAAALYYAAKLDELALFDVADLVARDFAEGALALPPSDLPLAYWRARNDRPSAAARAVACTRVVGSGTAAERLVGNPEAPLLLDRWLTAAAATPPDPEMAATYARALAANLSQHSSGLTRKIHIHLAAAVELLASPEALAAHGAANIWELVELVAARQLGRTIDVRTMRARAVAGTAALEWLADHATDAQPIADESLTHIARSWLAL